jgi:hypothetical protein
MIREITNVYPEGHSETHIEITNADGSKLSFPKDPANPVYAAWLERGGALD